MAFNRADAETFRLKDNMEQGFYRLYSTTENALMIQQAFEDTSKELDNKLLLLPEGFNMDLSKLSKELLSDEAAAVSHVED